MRKSRRQVTEELGEQAPDITMRQTTLAESLLLKGEYCGQGVLLLSTCLVERNRSTRGVFLLPADAKRPSIQQLRAPA